MTEPHESDVWRARILTDSAAVRDLLGSVRRMAVIGIRPDGDHHPAHAVPEYAQRAGITIIPVPVHYPDVTTILGEPVVRHVADAAGPIDLVEVFRRPEDIPAHLDDIIAARPRAVWFQLGIRNDEAAERLARAGVQVVQDRCVQRELVAMRR